MTHSTPNDPREAAPDSSPLGDGEGAHDQPGGDQHGSRERSAGGLTPGRILLFALLAMVAVGAYRSWRLSSRHVVTLTDENFDRYVGEAEGVAVVKFWAEWCPSCRAMRPTINSVAQRFEGRAVVAKLDVDAHPDLASRFGVSALPTLLIFRDGEVTEKAVGVTSAEELAARVASHLTGDGSPGEGSATRFAAVASTPTEQAVMDLRRAGARLQLDGAGGARMVLLTSTDVRDADLAPLRHLPRLEELYLGRNQLGDEGLAHLEELTTLVELNLDENRYTDAGLRHLARLNRLEVLSLEDSQITDAGLEALEPLGKLKELYLTGSRVTPVGVARLQAALPDTSIDYVAGP